MTNLTQKAAAGWAAAYGTLALGWTLTGHGFPFGEAADVGARSSPLRFLSPEFGAPLFAGVLLLTAVVALVMSGWDTAHRPARTLLLTYGWVVAGALLLVVPDARLLTLLGYAPILIIGAPFGWPPVNYGEVFTWTLANQAISVVGGLLLAAATLRWQFRTAGACTRCGRTEPEAGWTTPRSAARWGRWAVYVAAAVPAVYAFTRLAWAAGIPLGVPSHFLAEMRASGLIWAGLGLGGFALAGAVLTLGLTQRWGEVFPRWMIGLAGRRVPIRLATIPATLVAIFVTSAWIGFFTTHGFFTAFTGEPGAATLPMALWPLWGAGLGAATLAYHLRRRAACTACGRGTPDLGLVRARATEAY
jgi:hypothetical protein